MAIKKCVLLNDTFRLVPIDDRNWKLQEYAAPKGPRAKGDKPRWRECDRYFRSFKRAIEDCVDVGLKREAAKHDTTLEEAVAYIERAYREMADRVTGEVIA